MKNWIAFWLVCSGNKKFPLVMVHALQRGLSDHTPLLVDSSELAHVGNKTVFSFELSWFEREDFLELITTEWATENRGVPNIERWQYKTRHLRQFLRVGLRMLVGSANLKKKGFFNLLISLTSKLKRHPSSRQNVLPNEKQRRV